MKTTVDIDTRLLEQARRVLGTQTIKDTVERSFETVIQQDALARLAGAAGTMDLDLTAARVRQRRRRRTRGASG